MSEHYQTFDKDAPGDSNSILKLEESGFPTHLFQKTVLDIGCNAGFFLKEALERQARKVIGIERSKKFADDARETLSKYDESKYEVYNMDWNEGWPDGKFDLIVWFAAMHYETQPQTILDRIHDRLSNDGVFILETGIAHEAGDRNGYHMLPRPDEAVYYPSARRLKHLLSKFAVRLHAPSTCLPGQGNRIFYHCRKRQPRVVILKGMPMSGKTEMAASIDGAVVLSFDQFALGLESTKAWPGHTPFSEAIKAYEDNILVTQDKFWNYMRGKGLHRELVQKFLKMVTPDNDLYVLEGGLLAAMEDELRSQIQAKGHFKIWSMECYK